MYHYVYKITNNLNGKIYIGIHSTYDLNDGYMGSCIPLTKDIREFGIENFTKEIIDFYKNRKQILERERELVNEEFVKRDDTYNICLGGSCGTPGLVPVKDKDGNTFAVSKNDPRYINGELQHVIKGIKYNFSDEKRKARGERMHNLNSNTRKITNGIENRSIKSDKVEQFLKDNPGWRYGQVQHWSEESRYRANHSEKQILRRKMAAEKKLREKEERRLNSIKKREERKLIKEIWITDGLHNKKMKLSDFELNGCPNGWGRGFYHIMNDDIKKKIAKAGHKHKGFINVIIDGAKRKISPSDIGKYENIIIGWNNKNKNSKHPHILQYDKKENFIKEWVNPIRVQEELGIQNSSIYRCLNGKSKTAGGFIWKYKE